MKVGDVHGNLVGRKVKGSLLERGKLDLDERLQVEGRHTSLRALGVHLLDLRPRLGGGLLLGVLVGGRSLLGSHGTKVLSGLRLGRDCDGS